MCKKQYTGKTDNRLQKRISGHRSHVKKPPDPKDRIIDSDEAVLALHMHEHNFKSVELFNVNYSFTILEFDPPDLDKAEQKWASRLVTMEPFGLNIQKPCGVADKMITMSKKAAHSRRM